jgi:hypothetical protein
MNDDIEKILLDKIKIDAEIISRMRETMDKYYGELVTAIGYLREAKTFNYDAYGEGMGAWSINSDFEKDIEKFLLLFPEREKNL